MLYICEKQCGQCLFSKYKIVSDERKEEIIKSCKEDNDFFICHKSPEGDKWVCKGFYDNVETNTILQMKHIIPDMIPKINPKK